MLDQYRETCPYCYAPAEVVHDIQGFACRSQIIPNSAFEHHILRSAQCEGRQQMREQLLAWHDGEPPEAVERIELQIAHTGSPSALLVRRLGRWLCLGHTRQYQTVAEFAEEFYIDPPQWREVFA